jgi:hypothetical protein
MTRGDHFGRVNFSGIAIVFCDDEIWKGDHFGRVNLSGIAIIFCDNEEVRSLWPSAIAKKGFFSIFLSSFLTHLFYN